MTERMNRLLEDLAAAKTRHDFLMLDEELARAFGPPCSVEKLHRLERRLGDPLPPSYLDFLRLHDGWTGFDGEGALLSVADQEAPWVRERIDDWNAIFLDEGDPSPFLEGAIPIMMGPDMSNFAVLHPKTRRSDGEMEIVTYDNCIEEERFPDFYAYLEDDLESELRMIADQIEGEK